MEQVFGTIRVRHRSFYALYVKRLFDVIAALVLLAICAPIAGLAAIAIWIESGRPVMFVQERYGRGGKIFRMFKLRGLTIALTRPSVDDCFEARPRATRVGRVIRTLRIDEIPQLIHVVCGEMSLIGPRPLPVALVETLSRHVPNIHRRHAVRPGLLGYASASLIPELTFEYNVLKVQRDIEYVERLSFGLDMWVLFRAPLTLLRHLRTG